MTNMLLMHYTVHIDLILSKKRANLQKLLVRSTDEIQTQISFLTVPANFCKLSKQSTLILESLTSHVLLLTSILAKILTS